jgi:hypothetical protein
MKVVIRITNQGEELWIDEKWCCTHPRLLDGNTVAHNIALSCTERGFTVDYKLVGVKQKG